MRIISAKKIEKTMADLCLKANCVLRSDVLRRLKAAHKQEKNSRAKKALEAIIKNAHIAQKEKLAICQDTGMPVVFLRVGQDAAIRGDLTTAINKGIEGGYKKYYLRSSIVSDPLRRGKSGFSPCIIHTDIVKGNKIKLTLLPKGFGCENKSQLKMFKPTASIAEIKEFIIKAVKDAGPEACPPYVVGVGIGGTADYAGILAKKALLRRIDNRKPKTDNQKLANDLLRAVNRLNIGPMGLGGLSTVLAVHLQTYPTHIAGLPVSVNISCHALRSATAIL